MINFSNYKRSNPNIDFDVILTVHDSVMAEVCIKDVEHMANEVFPLCMTKQAICPALPFEIRVDIDVSGRWDEMLYHTDFIERDFSDEFAREYCKKDDDNNVVEKE